MSSKRKLEKRKKREKEAKKRVASERSRRIAEKAKENKEYKRLKRIEKLQDEMLQLNQQTDINELYNLESSTLSQLERNVEILKGLEEEYEQEQKKRDQLNENLESSGHVTLDQKLKAVQDQTVAQQKAESQVGVGGSANCSMQPKQD